MVEGVVEIKEGTGKVAVVDEEEAEAEEEREDEDSDAEEVIVLGSCSDTKSKVEM